jgi:hypothetical protein
MADETRPEGTSPNPAPPAQNPNQIVTDESGASTIYTNFCQAKLTPEEIVLNFGLNPQIQITEAIKITHRVVMNFYTAKRLLLLLQQVVGQHEAAFGVLELDFQKRVRSIPRPATPPATLRPGPT